MTQAILSDSFSYEEVDCIVRCDGGLSPETDMAVLGWVILDAETQVVLAEGRAVTDSSVSTTEAECAAVGVALKELQEKDVQTIIVQTDFDGFVSHFSTSNSTNIPTISQLEPQLSHFTGWSFEKRTRSDILQAHRLASSISQTNQEYVPEISLDGLTH